MADHHLSNEMLRALGDALASARSTPAVIVGRDGGVRFLNPCAGEILGREEVSAAGDDLRALVMPEDRPALDRLLSVGATDPALLRFADDGGTGVSALVLSAIALGPDHEGGVLLLGRDASAEVVREARVRAAERFEIVGQLASGIAHELNNALSTVTTFSDLLAAGADPGSETADDLNEIKEAALEAAAVIRKLDLFAGGGRPSDGVGVHLPEVVQGATKLLSRFLTRGVTLTLDLDGATPEVLGTPRDVEEILFALAANAKDALDGSGTVTISARPGGSAMAPTAVLQVADSGTGPRPPAADRAVEAFFSSKPLTHGTGLGLAVVDRIVTALGGTFRLEALAEGGAVASIELPGVEDASGPTPQQER